MGRKLSRRGFLQQSTLTSAGTILRALPLVVAAQGIDAASADGVAADVGQSAEGLIGITLEINGSARTLEVEPRATLAEVLRGPLGLKGTKIACNRGACSACTVWLDGAPVCSCMMLAVDVGKCRVTTIEGLAPHDGLHPVQASFIEHDAVQCGFCTPGMVMSCAALLRDRPSATESEVRGAISGHICRCGTFPHVIAACLALTKPPSKT
jgi:aerobic-type carbon monoxide dehydrogenase small subunit (CoxS/CutS family)